MKRIYKTILVGIIISMSLCAKGESAWLTDSVSVSNEEDFLTSQSYAVGSDGIYHVVFRRQTEGGFIGPGPSQAWYVYKDGDEWAVPELVSDGEGDVDISNPTITFTDDETVVIAYEKKCNDTNENYIMLAEKTEEDWNKQALPHEGDDVRNPIITGDSNNNLHIACKSIDEQGNSLIEYATNLSGDWETQEIAGTDNPFWISPQIAIDNEGIANILFINSEDELVIINNDEAGGDAWTSELLETGYAETSAGRILHEADTFHVVASVKDSPHDPEELFYFHKSNGEWSDGEQISDEINGEVLSLTLNNEGTIIVAGLEKEGWDIVGNLFIVEKSENESIEYIFPESDGLDVIHANIGIDPYGNMFVFYNNEHGFQNTNIFMAYQEVPSYSVSFDIVDEEGNPVSDASITLGDQSNPPGEYLFEDVEHGSYSLTIEATGFVDYIAEEFHVNQNLDLEMQLETATFSVLFEVEDPEENPIIDAEITLGEQTNSPGEYGFPEVEYGTYSYEVSADGFISHSAENLEVNEELFVSVILSPETFHVIFTIINEDGEEIDNATITLGDQTNQPGIYLFEDFEAGQYGYTIEADGYYTMEGELSLEEDTELSLTLERDITGINDVFSDNVVIYPNPVRDQFVIHSPTNIRKVRIVDLSGKTVMSTTPGCKNPVIQVSSLDAGIFLIEISTEVDSVTKKLYIQ